MSRRRAINPTRPIGITLKQSLIQRIDDYLNYNQSRSLLISNCIERYLDDSPSVSQTSTRNLMGALASRNDIDETLRELLIRYLQRPEKLPESGKN